MAQARADADALGDPLTAPIAALAAAVQGGALSAEELTRAALARIRATAALNAYVTVDEGVALAQARAVDARRAAGEALGALAGVPIAVKDSFTTRDLPTTCGSRILTRDGTAGTGWRPPYDATAVARLRAAGAVVVGKANQDEFAMGSSSETSAFGPVRNPWDPGRTAGGSSGGSAAAVAAATVPAALGSDTGGSVRQPAALTGVVGFKPSYGRISRYGLIAFASSLDTVGVFTRDVRSAARLAEVLAGPDGRDATALSHAAPALEAACDAPPRRFRIGVPDEYFAEGLEPDVAAQIRAALGALEAEGHTLCPVKLPHTRYGIATYYVIATAEASSNLARFDGVRFGLRVEPPRADLATLYGATRDAGFGREVKRRILLGTYVLSAGYHEAYYGRAQRARTLIARDFEAAFREVDVIAAPTSPFPAFPLGARLEDPVSMYLADVYTLPASLAGLPSISLPCGLTAPVTTPEGPRPALPCGLQLMAAPGAEAPLLALAARHEALQPPLPRAPA